MTEIVSGRNFHDRRDRYFEKIHNLAVEKTHIIQIPILNQRYNKIRAPWGNPCDLRIVEKEN